MTTNLIFSITVTKGNSYAYQFHLIQTTEAVICWQQLPIKLVDPVPHLPQQRPTSCLSVSSIKHTFVAQRRHCTNDCECYL